MADEALWGGTSVIIHILYKQVHNIYILHKTKSLVNTTDILIGMAYLMSTYVLKSSDSASIVSDEGGPVLPRKCRRHHVPVTRLKPKLRGRNGSHVVAPYTE